MHERGEDVHAALLRFDGIDDAKRGVRVGMMIREPEVRLHHTDNCVEVAAEVDLLPYCSGIASKLAHPECVAENDNGCGTECVILCADHSAEFRARAKHLVHSGITRNYEDFHGLGAAGVV